MPRPDPAVHTDHPDEQLDIDAGGNCRAPGCGYNSDVAHFAALDRGEDVYGDVPTTDPGDDPAEMASLGYDGDG